MFIISIIQYLTSEQSARERNTKCDVSSETESASREGPARKSAAPIRRHGAHRRAQVSQIPQMRRVAPAAHRYAALFACPLVYSATALLQMAPLRWKYSYSCG